MQYELVVGWAQSPESALDVPKSWTVDGGDFILS
jgi:hypothetical protein